MGLVALNLTSTLSVAAGQPVKSGIAWLALAVRGIAAVCGGLSMQAHALSGADLGGALGLSADEASWAIGAGAAAEGAAVLLTAFLVAAFGVRRVVVACCLLTTAIASISLAFSGGLVLLRFLEALACGNLPVVMMVWAMRAFPPPKRSLPLMLFAFASSFPSAIAPGLVGLATSRWGGLGIFAWDTIWPVPMAICAYLLLPREQVQFSRLATLDWFGYALLAASIMGILLVLNQGERRYWLETWWIAPTAAVSGTLLFLAIARLLTAPAPLLDLTLLTRPSFAIGMAEALSLRFALLMASFAVPQALARLQGFRPEQVFEAVGWLAFGQIVSFPLAHLWISRRDARWTLALGLALFAVAAAMAARIDPRWQIEQFRIPMLTAGLGQGFFLTSVMTFATWGVPAPAGATAAGLFNLTRVVGTAAATAAVGYLLRIRENGHSARLVEFVTSASNEAYERLASLQSSLAPLTPDVTIAQASATASLAQTASLQAYTLAFSDVFLAIAFVLMVFAVLVPMLPAIAPYVEHESA